MLGFEHFPDRLVGRPRMAVCLGAGNAIAEQPGVEIVQAFEPRKGPVS